MTDTIFAVPPARTAQRGGNRGASPRTFDGALALVTSLGSKNPQRDAARVVLLGGSKEVGKQAPGLLRIAQTYFLNRSTDIRTALTVCDAETRVVAMAILHDMRDGVNEVIQEMEKAGKQPAKTS